MRFAALASFRFFYASVCARLIARCLASSGTGGKDERTSLIPIGMMDAHKETRGKGRLRRLGGYKRCTTYQRKEPP